MPRANTSRRPSALRAVRMLASEVSKGTMVPFEGWNVLPDRYATQSNQTNALRKGRVVLPMRSPRHMTTHAGPPGEATNARSVGKKPRFTGKANENE